MLTECDMNALFLHEISAWGDLYMRGMIDIDTYNAACAAIREVMKS